MVSRLWRTHKKTLLIVMAVASLLFLYVVFAFLPYVLLGREPYSEWFLFRLLFLLTILIVCVVAWIKTGGDKKC